MVIDRFRGIFDHEIQDGGLHMRITGTSREKDSGFAEPYRPGTKRKRADRTFLICTLEKQ